MKIRKIILALALISVILTSCRPEPLVWEQAPVVQQMPLTTADYFMLLQAMPMNSVDNVLVRTFNEYLEAEYTPLFFTRHGLMNGRYHVLVPLAEQSGSVFNRLGMVVSIDIIGKHATLTRGRTSLTFTEGMISMFINREDVLYLPDMPIKYRGTLFIPFEPILNAFGIPYDIEHNVLIIGG